MQMTKCAFFIIVGLIQKVFDLKLFLTNTGRLVPVYLSPANQTIVESNIRVIDESGEDYLYPSECFVDANLPEKTRAAVVEAA